MTTILEKNNKAKECKAEDGGKQIEADHIIWCCEKALTFSVPTILLHTIYTSQSPVITAVAATLPYLLAFYLFSVSKYKKSPGHNNNSKMAAQHANMLFLLNQSSNTTPALTPTSPSSSEDNDEEVSHSTPAAHELFFRGLSSMTNIMLSPYRKDDAAVLLLGTVYVICHLVLALYASFSTFFSVLSVLALLFVNMFFYSATLKAIYTIIVLAITCLFFWIHIHPLHSVIYTLMVMLGLLLTGCSLLCTTYLAQAALRKLYDNHSTLTQANSLKSSFLSAIGHEVRTPLHCILGSADLLLLHMNNKSATRLNNEQANLVKTIVTCGNMLLDNLNSVLEFTKIEGGNMHIEHTNFDLKDAIADIILVMKSKLDDKGLKLQYDYQPNAPTYIKGDKIRFKQVLLNLFSNACKFTHSGEVALSVKYDTHEDSADNKGEFVFEVRDTGIGMKQEMMSLLFRPFTQADMSSTRRYGGYGLGLAVSKGLVDLMGGKIWAKSKENVGTSFFVGLPFEPVMQEDTPRRFDIPKPMNYNRFSRRASIGNIIIPQSITLSQELHSSGSCETSLTTPRDFTTSSGQNSPSYSQLAAYSMCGWGEIKPDHNHLRFLVVDDNNINCRVLSKMLQNLNVEHDVVMSGAEAIKAVEANSEAYDFIFMDIYMPEMDGHQTTSRIREIVQNSEWPLIYALTGNETSESQEGFNGWLAKPMGFTKLKEVVQMAKQAKKKMQAQQQSASGSKQQ